MVMQIIRNIIFEIIIVIKEFPIRLNKSSFTVFPNTSIIGPWITYIKNEHLYIFLSVIDNFLCVEIRIKIINNSTT